MKGKESHANTAEQKAGSILMNNPNVLFSQKLDIVGLYDALKVDFIKRILLSR